MFNKASVVRFFAVVIVIFSIGARVLADVQFKGPILESKQIVFDKDTFDYTIDYRATYAFYNTTNRQQEQLYTLHIGGCKLEFRVEYCIQLYRHHQNQWEKSWRLFHDDFPSGTVNPSSISFLGYINYIRPCTPQFDSSLVPGRYVIDVSLSGEVSPDLVVNFIGAELFDTSMVPTTTTTPKPTIVSTTQALSSSLLTSTSMNISTTFKPPCPQCEKRGLESWLIGLIVAIIVLAILAILLCAILFCCYRRMQKAKAQKVVQSEHPTVGSTMSTVSTAPGPLVKETNLYGPDMMYFGRDATPVDPNAKSQAVSPGPQATSPAPQAVSTAPATSPMQPAK